MPAASAYWGIAPAFRMPVYPPAEARIAGHAFCAAKSRGGSGADSPLRKYPGSLTFRCRRRSYHRDNFGRFPMAMFPELWKSVLGAGRSRVNLVKCSAL
jgi:hypothetical protein